MHFISRGFASAALATLLVSLPVARSLAQSTLPPMTVAVDASEVTRGILHVHETIPVSPGPLTLAYPKWIPGEHAPNGQIANLATLAISANGAPLMWRRDPVDLYTFTLNVPAGVSSLDVTFDFLGAVAGWGSSVRFATPNILVLNWNKVLLAPNVADYRLLAIEPSIQLPGPEWQFGTALAVASQQGTAVRFKPVSEEMLVDSPLDAGLNVKKFALGTLEGVDVELDAFADTQAELDAGDITLGKLRNVVTQMQALYHARHFNRYTFLVTVSDLLQVEGVEHHQSSDDGTSGDFLTTADGLAAEGDLLPHEFNHSWDGKYRRPADLATPNLQVPMQDDLLWVYEGMTEFYGQLQAERSGIWSRQQWLDELATTYAELDTTTGRMTKPLVDTAVAASVLYGSGRAWESARRGVDFYQEGELMWLEADVTIRRLSHGRRSIDDVARAFFGREDTGPRVVTYTREDVIAALNAVQPYDWRSFLAARVDAIAPHPPDAFDAAGWHIVYTATPSAFAKLQAAHRKTMDARYSIGLVAREDGTVTDVITGSPAARAGIGPGAKIVAIDGRAADHEPQAALDNALRAAQTGASMHLLILGGEVYRDVALDYHGGPRFPHLERIPGTADLLSAVAAPRAAR